MEDAAGAASEAGGRERWVRGALERYEAPLVAWARRATGDLDRARDLVQDTFLELCGQDPAALDGRLGPWLFAVCRRRAIDVRRKEARMGRLGEATADAAGDPARAAERAEDGGRACTHLEALPERQREVLRLRFQHGLSYAEIAAALELSIGTVGFHVHAGLNALRQRLGVDARASGGSA